MHEARRGEMAALGEVPFARYYGGVDTTPLFVALAGAYARRTGDFALIERLWPALERAMTWIVSNLDAHPEGLLGPVRPWPRHRAFEPGLEGLRRFHLPRRRAVPDRPDRAR